MSLSPYIEKVKRPVYNENMDLSIALYFYLKIPRFFFVTDFYNKGGINLFFQDKWFKRNS